MTSVHLDSGTAERPDPHGDPRALSQAWYDALYGQRDARRDDPAAARPPRGSLSAVLPATASTASSGASVAFDARVTTAAAVIRTPAGSRADSFEAEPAPIASGRRTRAAAGEAFTAGEETPELATVAIASEGLALEVRRERDGIRIVASCRREAASGLEDALERARGALAARGVRMTSQLDIRGDR